MAHSFLTYNSHLAQMPTDQRELEYHRLLVQTEFLNTNGILQANALRPYNPCYPPPDWPPFRPAPAMKSTVLHPHPGYSDSWAATVSEPYHFDISYLAQNMVPGSSYHPQTYFAPISRPAPVFPSQSIMDHPRPSVTECEQENSMEWHHAEPLTSSWLSQQQLHQRTKLDGFDETFQSFAGSSQSPITVSSRHSPSRSYNGSPIGTGSTSISMGAEDISPHTSPEDTCEEDHSTEPPYSQLIYQALVEQKEEGYKLPLQGIYAWFEKNTNKGKDHSQKGWQNSIRHNLSMNAVCAPACSIMLYFWYRKLSTRSRVSD